MLFLLVGLVLLTMKLVGWGPVAAWGWDTHWWAFGAPFAAAVLWWEAADFFGWSKRKAMAQDNARRQARRERHMDALGRPSRKKR